ncbi:peptidyl-prolyl cis-trans isomerase D [Desulfobaculum xiamenense]|uniref:Periplasmic chaperone PpiD n=1 Tax=Desulfobaculum xiamenense TaxID=995050 RepID=A0A846QL26_9BACT|nr:SurA N-terminal domain-containing protein [Desulfobaculum xiamenense]NJB68821.1 peptidyl-prolyl cis-trans isomerase D [Desulfobaculum xiamenense]
MLDGMRQHASSWIVKILFGIIIVVFVFAFGSGTLSNRANGGAVLAYVNESPILIKDFEMAYQRAVEALRRQNPGISSDDLASAGFKNQVLNRMINDSLLTAEADRLGVTVSKDEIRARILEIEAFRNKDNAFDTLVYQAVLRGSHLQPAEFEADMAEQIRSEKLRKHLNLSVTVTEEEAYDMFRFAAEQARIEYLLFGWKDFADQVTPADADIENFYKTNEANFRRPATADFATLTFTPRALAARQDVTAEEMKVYYDANMSQFEQPEMVSARHILIKVAPGASAAEVETARKKLLDIQGRLSKGESFAQLAEKYSEGPSSVRGGDLGWFPRGAMVEPFEKAAFALEAGHVSAPVRTDFGWHLIRVDEKRAAGVKTFDEAREEIRSLIAEEKASERISDVLDQALEQILAGDKIDKIAADAGLTAVQTGPMTKDMLASRLGVSEEDADRLFSTSLGTGTDTPVSVDQGYMIAFKVAETEATIAPLDEVREQIVEALKRQGATALAQGKADAVLAELRDADKAKAAMAEYGKSMEKSAEFGRQGFIPGLGMNPGLVEAAFLTEVSNWLPQSYTVGEGVVIARMVERVMPSDKLWNTQKDYVLDALTRTKENEMFQAFLKSLRDKAEIRVADSRVLE